MNSVLSKEYVIFFNKIFRNLLVLSAANIKTLWDVNKLNLALFGYMGLRKNTLMKTTINMMLSYKQKKLKLK